MAGKRKPKATRKPKRRVAPYLMGTLFVALVAALVAGAAAIAMDGERQTAVADVVIKGPTPKPRVTPLPADWQPVSSYRVPILMYHHVGPMPQENSMGEGLTVTNETLAKQLDYLKQNGYTPITFTQLKQMVLPPKPVILTFDDGYKDAYDSAFKMLQERKMVGVFYIVSGFVGDRNSATWDQLREMQEAGMEMGAHSISHPDLAAAAAKEARQQIDGSIQEIERQLDTDVITFAYPAGKFSSQTVELLRAAGILYGVTTQPGIATSEMDQQTLPRVRVFNTSDMATLLR